LVGNEKKIGGMQLKVAFLLSSSYLKIQNKVKIRTNIMADTDQYVEVSKPPNPKEQTVSVINHEEDHTCEYSGLPSTQTYIES
jgi:hypothetical protein